MNDQDETENSNIIDFNQERLYRVADKYNFIAGKPCVYKQGQEVSCTVVERYEFRELQFIIGQCNRSGPEYFSYIVFIPELERYALMYGKRQFRAGDATKCRFSICFEGTIHLDSLPR